MRILLFVLLLEICNPKLGASVNSIAPQVSIPIQLMVPGERDISTDHLYVGDLVECQGIEAVCNEIKSIYIAQSPNPGDSQYIATNLIRSYIEEEIPTIKLKVGGAESIKVKAVFQSVDIESLRQELQAAINQVVNEDEINIQVGTIPMGSRVKIRPGTTTWEFPKLIEYINKRLKYKNLPHQKYCGISHTKYQSLTSHSSICFRPKLKIRYWLPVSSRDLIAGTVMKEEDVSMGWVKESQTVARSFKEIIGKTLKRGARRGVAIKKNLLDTPYLIRRGKEIEAIINSGGMMVRSRGKVLGSGRLGEYVTVRLANSNKVARAKIISSNEVEVVR